MLSELRSIAEKTPKLRNAYFGAFLVAFEMTKETQGLCSPLENLFEAVSDHSVTESVIPRPWHSLSMQPGSGQHLRSMTK